jgi:hypothetical protein
MTDHSPYRRPNNCASAERQRRNPAAADVNPWDNEPTWPGAEYDDDEAVADGMGDDDDVDAPAAWQRELLAFQQPSLWDEAITRICAYRSPRGGCA